MPTIGKGKVLFVHVPRTGGTSIEHMFRPSDLMGVKQYGKDGEYGRYAQQSMTLEELVEFGRISEDRMLNMFKFCFVRNPWDKLVSDFVKRSKDFESYINEAERVMGEFKKGENPCVVANFGSTDCQDNHIRQQVDFIRYKGEEVMNFIGRYEEYDKSVRIMCELSGIPEPEEILHVRKSKREHYSKYYNKKTRETVAKMFADDIERFGYTFEEEQI